MKLRKLFGKFLGTFASQGPTTLSMSYPGASGPVLFTTEYELTSALANTETLTLDLPAQGSGIDVGVGGTAGQGKLAYIPVLAVAYSNADPQVLQTAFAITSFDRDTGRVVLTATGAVANNSVVLILWAQCTLGVT